MERFSFKARTVESVYALKGLMRIAAMPAILRNHLAALFLQGDISAISGTHVGRFNTPGSPGKELVRDLIQHCIPPRTAPCRLASAHSVKRALAGSSRDEKAIFKSKSHVTTARRNRDPSAPKNGTHWSFSLKRHGIREPNCFRSEASSRIVAIGVGEWTVGNGIFSCHPFIKCYWIGAIDLLWHEPGEFGEPFEAIDAYLSIYEVLRMKSCLRATGDAETQEVEEEIR
jgi:hypothetical protein